MKVVCFLPDSIAFQNKLGMLTRSAGVNFQPCTSEEEAKVFATNERKDRFFLFAEAKKIDFLKDFSANYPECRIVVILQESLQRVIPSLIDCSNIQCFVATNNGEFDARELIMLLKKFESKDYPGLEKHLNFPAVFKEKRIKSQSDKRDAIKILEEFILKIGGNSDRFDQYAQRVCDLADELLLNAVFDANPRLKTADRSAPFELIDTESVRIKWGFDGEVFGLSVADPFGSLSKKTVMQYLDENQKTEHIGKRDSGGLGIKLIFERLHHYIVNVNPGKMTEIVCLMRFEKRFKDFDKRLRSFHYFKVEDSQ
ncbi:hypothetical protein [Fluviispira sanaruensis]|uniref:Uncharacterized protein n=1 Tax=Fluviispira sanaruensis TaxID=2493639 RepID=A0A4P2VL84_FLUSA|nr:hypothetical protein [Fluviispira sanaruensis]BBH54103.1 hypothetical protein JCM31447_25600 [Fluviispira sanaruensis]